MFFRYVGEAKMSKPMKSVAQLSLVVTSYMARLHGNDDISGIGKNASSPIDSLDLGVPSIARCPLPSFHRWTMLAALPPLSRYGSGVPPPPPSAVPSTRVASVTNSSIRTYTSYRHAKKHALTWTGCASLPACCGEDATVPQRPLFRVGPICRAYQLVSSEKGTRGGRGMLMHRRAGLVIEADVNQQERKRPWVVGFLGR